jgi:putative phosphoesterase
MKIAVLSDIHGNLTALNAVLNDIKDLGINKYIIAGDHICDCPEPNEVLEKVKSLNGYIIKGNREEYVLNYHKGMHDEWNKYKQKASVVWTHNTMDKDNIKYIEELPEQLSISLPQMDTIRVVHGSPFAMREDLFPDKYPERLEKALNTINESVLICGHTHESWSKVSHNKLVVNPGSVGVPFNKSKCAEYAVLTWEVNKWTASHHKVKYDLKELEDVFYESGLFKSSRAWSRVTLRSIKEGEDLVMDFIKYAYNLAENNGFSNSNLVPNCIWDKAEAFWFK